MFHSVKVDPLCSCMCWKKKWHSHSGSLNELRQHPPTSQLPPGLAAFIQTWAQPTITSIQWRLLKIVLWVLVELM